MTDKLKTFLSSAPIDWLLNGEPFVRYRTLIDIVERDPGDAEVVSARKAVGKSKIIRQILNRQNRTGYWGKPEDIFTWWPRKDTTFWVLGMLADFGLDKSTKKIAASIPNAVFEIIDECGHMVTMEKPQITTALMQRWIRL